MFPAIFISIWSLQYDYDYYHMNTTEIQIYYVPLLAFTIYYEMFV